ncbi:hypothetical protein DXG01_015241 [Tephrocybe rancida]|nr:hypothetical protein DXG01_015241 [Tephrocybe rancida]
MKPIHRCPASAFLTPSLFPLVDLWYLALLNTAAGTWASPASAPSNPFSISISEATHALTDPDPAANSCNYLLNDAAPALQHICHAHPGTGALLGGAREAGGVHRLTASLAFLLRLSPVYESQVSPLLEVLQARDVLKRKLAKGGCGEEGVTKKGVRELVEDVAMKLCP